MSEHPTGLECKFVVHVKTKNPRDGDFHVAKLQRHMPDGTRVPMVRIIKDFKRDVYIEKPAFRNHEEKREEQLLENLDRIEVTQTEMAVRLRHILNIWNSGNDKAVLQHKWVYGTDIKSTCLVKKKFQDNYPGLISLNTVCGLDVETDVLHGTDEIILLSAAMGDRVFLAIKKSFVGDMPNIIERVMAKAREMIEPMIMDETDPKKNPFRKAYEYMPKLEVQVYETEIELVVEGFKRVHEWKPDFLAIWNMDFDIGKITTACQKAGYPLAELFSDPSVPPELKFYEYVEPQFQKVTESGKITPMKPPQQWSTVRCPASFYVIDPMRVYYARRVQVEGEQPSYALDYVLNDKIKRGKLKFEELGDRTGLAFHIFMQDKHPIEYSVYNIFDTISMLVLDATIRDLCMSLPSECGISDFVDFKKQPRRNADKLHFFMLENQRVIGTSGNLVMPIDEMLVDRKGWICTLPIHQVVKDGLKLFSDAPDVVSNCQPFTFDIDVTGSYPHGGITQQVSRGTTMRERLKFMDPTQEWNYRRASLNLTAGTMNAVQICNDILGMPKMTELQEIFLRDHPHLAA